MTFLAAYLASSSLLTWFLCRLFQRSKRLDETVQRHPAGRIQPGADGWTPPPNPDPTLWPFRARPCRHQLWSESLDETEMEHLELLHTQNCYVARELSGRNAA